MFIVSGGEITIDEDGYFMFDANGNWDICGDCCTPRLAICKIVATDYRNNTQNTPSLATVDGSPAIAYQARVSSANSLRYVRAIDADGYGTWPSSVVVDSTSGDKTGYGASMQIVDGNPAIAYKNASEGLSYVRATNSTGSAWGTPITVDSTELVSQARLLIVDGYPAIAYAVLNGSFYRDIKFVRATNADGSSWGTPVVVKTGGAGTPFHTPDCAIIDGRPAIACQLGATSDLIYIRSDDAQGSSWPGSHVVVDTVGTTGNTPYLSTVDGYPAIAYYYTSGTDLKYVRATDATGSAWGTPVTAADGVSGRLQSINSKPYVINARASGGGLYPYYTIADNATGSAWGTPVLINPIPGHGIDPLGFSVKDPQIINGNPSFVTKASTDKLIYARAADADGTDWDVDEYYIPYNGNGNTGGSVPWAHFKIYAIELTLETNSGALAKTGKTFDGWNTAADGTGTDYAEGAIYAAEAAATLYAKWI